MKEYPLDSVTTRKMNIHFFIYGNGVNSIDWEIFKGFIVSKHYKKCCFSAVTFILSERSFLNAFVLEIQCEMIHSDTNACRKSSYSHLLLTEMNLS